MLLLFTTLQRGMKILLFSNMIGRTEARLGSIDWGKLNLKPAPGILNPKNIATVKSGAKTVAKGFAKAVDTNVENVYDWVGGRLKPTREDVATGIEQTIEGTAKAGKMIAQETFGGLARLGRTELRLLGGDFKQTETDDKIQSAVFGRPAEAYQDIAPKIDTAVARAGATEGERKVITPLIVGASMFLDYVGKGKGAVGVKGLIKDLSETVDPAATFRILTSAGVDEKIAREAAPRLAPIKDTTEMAREVASIERLQQTTVATQTKTPEQSAKEVFDKKWAETYGNRPPTVDSPSLLQQRKRAGTPEIDAPLTPRVSEVAFNRPLAKEAQKYSSLEEFLKAQQKVFRGGSSNEITEKGLSVSTNENIAKTFALARKGTVGELYISPNAKIVDIYDIPTLSKDKAVFDYNKANPPLGDKGFMSAESKYQIAAKWAKDNGYDAVKLPTEGEIRVVNPEVLKTKSQLTDFYNKVRGASIPTTKPAPPVPSTKVLPKKTDTQPAKPPPKPPTKDTAVPSKGVPSKESSPRTIGERIGEVKTKIVEYVQNTEERVRQLMNRKDITFDDSSNIYQKMTLFAGRLGEKIALGHKAAQEIAQDIISLVGRGRGAVATGRADVNEYLQALHASERNAALGEGAAGMTDAEAKAILDKASPEIKAIAQKALDLHKQTLEMLRDSGVISDDLFKALREKYKNHVPLQRVMDEADDMGDILSGRGFDVKTTGIKRAVGSDREVADILTNIVTNFEQAAIRSEKNIYDLSTLAFVRKNERVLEDIFTIKKPKALGKDFSGERLLMERTNDPTILQMFEDGKPIWIKIKDPNLAIALRGVGREKLGITLNVVRAVTNFYAGLHTRFNPEFALPNKIRDLQETITFLASQKDVGAKGLGKFLTRDPKSVLDVVDAIRGGNSAGARLYNELKAMGGTTGGMGLSTRNQVEMNIDKIFATARSRPRQAAQKLVEYVDDWNKIFEDSTRLSVYRASLAQGLSKERSAFLAKEASINFNRMGKGGPIVNALYMFSNAAIQGSVKMIRAMKNPKVAASVITVVGGAVAATNTWNDSVDPDWRDKVTKWDRMNGLTIMLPTEGKDARYFTIPVSWGIKPILVMANGASDAINGQDFSGEQLVKDVFSSILNAYNPIGGTDIASAIVPTVADLPVEIARNKTWSGAQIRPSQNPFGSPTPKDIQYFSSLKDTVEGRLAVKATEKIRETGILISPADMNYAFQQITGGAGRMVEKTANTLWGFASDDPVPVDEYPFVSRFYRERPEEENRNAGQSKERDRLEGILSEQSREDFYRKEQAKEMYQVLKELPTEEANARFELIKGTDPLLATKIRSVADAEKKGLTSLDYDIQDLHVENGERAKYIFEILKDKKTNEEKNAYVSELEAKGILTKEVKKQLRKMLQVSPTQLHSIIQ